MHRWPVRTCQDLGGPHRRMTAILARNQTSHPALFYPALLPSPVDTGALPFIPIVFLLAANMMSTPNDEDPFLQVQA